MWPRALLLAIVLVPTYATPPALPPGAETRLIEVDDAGNGYVAGYLAARVGPANSTVRDGFVMKYRLDSGTQVYFKPLTDATTSMITSIAVDRAGALYFTGTGSSSSFLGDSTVQGVNTSGLVAAQGMGVLVAKLLATGEVAYARLLEAYIPSDIAVNSAGEAYLTGEVLQGQLSPTPGAVVARTDAPRTGFIAKLNAAGDKLTLVERGIGGLQIALDAAANIYVTGNSGGTIDPPITPNAFQTTHTLQPCGGTFFLAFACPYAHVAKLDPTGGALLYSTYLNGTFGSSPRALAVDAEGNAYIAGSTRSSNYPVTEGVIGPVYRPGPPKNPPTTFRGVIVPPANTGFVTKLNPAGAGLVFSTFLGGSVTDQLYDLRLHNGRIYLAGEIGSEDIQGGGATVQECLPRTFIARLNGDGKSLTGDVLVLAKSAPSIAIEPNGTVHTPDFSDPSFESIPAPLHCIVDAASRMETSTVAPGQVLSIFGPSLTLSTQMANVSPNQPLPTVLGGAAEFNGTPARLLYTSPRQVNLIAPYAISTSEQVTLHYHSRLAGSLNQILDFPLSLTPRAPATFEAFGLPANYCGTFLPAFAGPTTLVHNEDGSVNTCTNPARAGSTATIFLNGGGSAAPALDESQVAQQKTPLSVPASVQIGPEVLEVVNFSLDPGSPVGVWRLEFRLPNRSGAIELEVTVDGLAIQQKRLFLFTAP